MPKIVCAINFKKFHRYGGSFFKEGEYRQSYENAIRKRFEHCLDEMINDMLSEFKTSGRMQFTFDDKEFAMAVHNEEIVCLPNEENHPMSDDMIDSDNDMGFEAVSPDPIPQNNYMDSLIRDEMVPDITVPDYVSQINELNVNEVAPSESVPEDNGQKNSEEPSLIDNIPNDSAEPSPVAAASSNNVSLSILHSGKPVEYLSMDDISQIHRSNVLGESDSSITIMGIIPARLSGHACIFIDRDKSKWRLFDYMFKKGYISSCHLLLQPRLRSYYVGLLQFVSLNGTLMMVIRPVCIYPREAKDTLGKKVVPPNTNMYYSSQNAFVVETEFAVTEVKKTHHTGGVSNMTLLANWEVNAMNWGDDSVMDSIVQHRERNFVKISELFALTNVTHSCYREWKENVDDRYFRQIMRCPDSV